MEENAAVGEVRSRTHPLFDGDAGERLAEDCGVGRAGSQGGKPAGFRQAEAW